jgi:carbonic anhydrase
LRTTDWSDPDIKDAVEGHERFKQQFERDKSFYRGLATRKQKPRLLWIGCSDSRVVPAQITSADPGELFEIRNIANVVPPADSDDDSVGAAIAYALDHLGVDDIVVCGHSGCGGIQALLDDPGQEIPGHLGNWINFTRPAHRLVALQKPTEADRLQATIKAHVQFQIDNLMTYPRVRQAVESGTVGVHGWLYVMETGDLLAYDAGNGDWQPLGASSSGR